MRVSSRVTVILRLSAAGFSLIWMSIFLCVASIIMVSALPGNEAGDYNAKALADARKLQRIEEAMRSFMATYRRRPCPADGQYPVNTQYFGTEAAIAGTCTGGTPAAPMGPDAGTGNIVSGVIPTKSLGLPDEIQFDSYGRRFTYVVDKRATTTGTCLALEGITSTNFTPTGTGGLVIKDMAENTLDNTMYAYIQHGPSGYGAWPESGSKTTLTSAQSVASRVNSKSTDKWMQINAGVDVGANPGASTFTYSTANFTNTRYRNSRTFPATTGGNLDTGFDDFLYYRNDIKNTCCLGPKCIPLGFRVDGSAAIGTGGIQVVGVGDINGDGHPDLVISVTSGYAYTLYVIFGTSNTGGGSSTPWPIPPTGFDPGTINGTNGFKVVGNRGTCCGSLYGTPLIADLNGDGYDDIIVGAYPVFAGGGTQYSATKNHYEDYVIFGGSGGVTSDWVSGGGSTVYTANLAGYTGVNGTSGIIVDTYGMFGSCLGATSWSMPQYEVGDIDNSGYNSLIHISALPGPYCNNSSATWGGYVLYGRPPTGAGNTWQNATTPFTASSFDGTNGFLMSSSTAASTQTGGAGITNFDGDAYNDITITYGVSYSGQTGLTVLYGRSQADWSALLSGSPAQLDVSSQFTTTPNGATMIYGFGVAGGTYTNLADVNGDGKKDLMISGSGTIPTVVYNQGSRWPATFNTAAMTTGQGFTISMNTLFGSMYPQYLTAAKLNNDSLPDLLVSYTSASPLSRNSAGAVLTYYQPSGGWPLQLKSSNFKWDGTDGFQIYGPKANSLCNYSIPSFIGDVRYGDGNKPEIMISCRTGETGYGSIYGLYENHGWPSSIDLNDLN